MKNKLFKFDLAMKFQIKFKLHISQYIIHYFSYKKIVVYPVSHINSPFEPYYLL